MGIIPLFDLVATVGFAAACICAWRTGDSILRRSSRIMLLAFLGVRLFIGLADILEDSGITDFFDLWEDYAAILFLPLFVMFMYSVMMSEEVESRLRSEGELREANEELERQYHDLQKLDRMKDSFMRNVSHELKTPVAKHAMQIELLEKAVVRHGLGDECEKIIDVMKGCVERQSLVIRNLLELSRLESGGEDQRWETVRVDELIRQVVEDYGHATAQQGIEVEERVPETSIRSDRDMLWHIFSNLVSNAIKFRRREGEAKIQCRIDEEEGGIVVRITDNGPGMTPGDRERAFEKFFQATASAEGSGVGLTISRMIVEKLGGSIRLEEGPGGEGTTAVVTLPRDGNSRR